jgi:hypothetical protein
MENTSFLLSDLNVSNIAKPFVLTYRDDSNASYLSIPHYTVCFYPGGALRTSVNDLSHFLIAHMNNGIYDNTRILEEETVELMHMIHSSKKGKYLSYGLGWAHFINRLGLNISGHTGSLYCYNSCMKYRELDDVGLIYFVNRNLDLDVRGKIAGFFIEKLLFFKAFSYFDDC